MSVAVFLAAAGASVAAVPRPVPDNNATQCVRRVRRELLRIKPRRWGAFEFNCAADGSLEDLFFPVGSRAARDFAGFLRQHGALFDEEAVELADVGDPAGPALVRQRRGLPFHSGALAGESALFVDGRRLRAFSPPPHARIPEDFPVVPAVSSQAAAATALREARALRASALRVREIELMIEDRRCRDRLRPTLAWWVRLAEAGSAKQVSCYVDAGSGQACGQPPCRSSADPAE